MSKVAMNIKVTANCDEDMVSFLRLCTMIQECGRRGSGRTFKVVVDGDGSGKYTFYSENKDKEFEQFPFMDEYDDSDEEIKIWLGE